MIYFLGGPPRVGKSKIAQRIARDHGISSVSTDSLGAVLESVLDPRASPGLFAVSRFNELPLDDRIDRLIEETSRHIDDQIEECTATWEAVVPFVRREAEEGRDVLVEGVAVLPELVAGFDAPDSRAVFVGQRRGNHEENLRRGAAENDRDWLRGASDDYMRAFAIFVQRMSRYVAEKADEHGLAYIELSETPFEEAADRVGQSLRGARQP